MRFKSRILALILCVVMAFSLAVTASAQGDESTDSDVQTMASKQTLDVILLMGQSNAEGLVDSEASSYDTARKQSIVCDEESIFSTVVPINSGGRYTTGCTFSTLATADNAGNYVAKSLSSNVSRNGNTLEYPLNSLSKNGAGKSGVDSGLAYEWNQLTDDATWIVNITYSGSMIKSWQPGESNYETAIAAIDNVMATYNSETGSSGNYSAGNVYMVWMQGETDCTSGTSVSDYQSMFTTFYNGIKSEVNKYASFKGCGFITVRSSRGSYLDSTDLENISARTAQVNLANNNSDITIASDANEDWVSDSGVNNYFMSWYPNGIDYPTHALQITRPTTPYEVHPTIHYSQIGHNENGITAARGLYNVFYAKTASSGSTKGTIPAGVYQPTSSNTDIVNTTYSGKSGWWYTVNGVVDTSFTGFAHNQYGWWYVVNGLVDFTYQNCVIYGTVGGVYGLWYVGDKDNGNKVLTDQNGILDEAASDGNWYYVVNGKVDFDYVGVANTANQYGWWYVKDGKVDFSFTGLAENVNGWWYVSGGKVDFSHTGLYDGVVNGISGTWYVVADKVQTDFCGFYNGYFINNGLVDKTYTSVTTNSDGVKEVTSNGSKLSPQGIVYTNNNGYVYYRNGKMDTSFSSVEHGTVNGEEAWWYIENGKVNTSYTGVSNYSNDYGWWYLKNGKVDFDFTGFAKNNYGWWYVEGGQVKFNQYTVLQDTKGEIDSSCGWWYIVESKVQTDYTGVTDYSNGLGESSGYWYVVNGKVDFSVTTVAQNSWGWWYVRGGEVRFDYTGFAQNQYGWWWCKGGQVIFADDIIEDTAKIVDGTDSWYYCPNGCIDFTYTERVSEFKNANGWWYIEKGKVVFTDTIAENSNGWWYCPGGKVDFSYTNHVSEFPNANGWWYIGSEGGKVDFTYNGFGQNSNGWWVCSGGKVIFSDDIVQDTNKVVDGTDSWYYCPGGCIDFDYSYKVSDFNNAYGWWYIVKGKVDFSVNTVAQNSYGWWYVVGGKVDFSYTGVSNYPNEYGSGWWYIKNGQVDFSYTGWASNNYGTWYVVNGEVDFSKS